MDIEERIKEIYGAHKKTGLYNDTFENTIYWLTNAYDYFYLEATREIIDKARTGASYNGDSIWDEFDNLRHSYRACIKFVCEDCKHGTFNRRIDLNVIKDYQNEMKDAETFNCIRNAIDRYRLGRYIAKEVNGKLCFEHVKGERSLIYDAYSRHIADEIPGGKNSKDDVSTFNLQFFIIQLASQKQEFISKKLFKPANHILKNTILVLLNYYLRDYDFEIGSIMPTTYSLGEYFLCYCYLAAISVYKTAYLLSLRGKNDLTYEPSFLYPKDRLITDISELLTIDEKTVTKIINDMIYDYDFHKEKVTIFQPLFEIDGNIVCSVNMLFHSYVVDKITRFFDSRGTNKEQLSLYHRYMAEKMNHRLATYLPKMYPNLHTFENKTLVIDKTTLAEVDLLIFDDYSKVAVLVELKNYTPVDNDQDAIWKEDKINKAIESRLEKDKRVLDNLNLFFKQNELPSEYLDYTFSSLLITSSFAGGVDVREHIKVLDEALFYYILHLCNGNLSASLEIIQNGTFFDILEKNTHFADADIDYNYKGITVEVINK